MRRVLILTDHSGLPFALNSGYGRSEAYNEVCARLASDMPWLSSRAAHIRKIMFSLVHLLGGNACYEMKKKIFL